MPYCCRCGKQVAEGDPFCCSCGARQHLAPGARATELPRATPVSGSALAVAVAVSLLGAIGLTALTGSINVALFIVAAVFPLFYKGARMIWRQH